MNNKAKYFMDLHTHTIAAGHAYSTLQENIAAAREKGLKFLGYSEHGIAMPGGPHPYFFQNFKCLPKRFGDLQLFCGVEANIMDYDGTLDMNDESLSRLDYCIASLHIPCCKPGTAKENTRAYLMAMKNPYVTIIGHPDDSRYPIDYDVLVKAAKEEGVFLEVNTSSLNPRSVRQGGRENIAMMLQTCMKYDCPVIMNSDAHYCGAIGEFSDSLTLMEEIGFPEHLIANSDERVLEKIVRNASL